MEQNNKYIDVAVAQIEFPLIIMFLIIDVCVIT